MAKLVKKSPAPLYFAAAVWLAWGILCPLYLPKHFVMAAVLSFIAAMLCKVFFPDKTFEVPEEEKEEKKSSGNPEIDALVSEGDKAIGEMKRLNAAIEDPAISAQIDRLEADTRKIVALVSEKPEKLPQIKRFMNYYLPTTLKLLNVYDRMDDAGISGENIDSTKKRVEKMMSTIVVAFDKQLDALFGDEALDISTDITVMENLLKQEGLGGETVTAEDPEGGDGVTLQL